MQRVVIALACVACAGRSQRLHELISESVSSDDAKTLARLLFTITTATSQNAAMHRQGFVGNSNARRVTHRAASTHMVPSIDFEKLDGKEVKVGIISARQNGDVSKKLVAAVKESLIACGVDSENIAESEVPTPFELPYAARLLAISRSVDAVVPIGVMSKDDVAGAPGTMQSVSSGLMNIALQSTVPIVNGLIAADNDGDASAFGTQWGKVAVEMGLFAQASLGKKKASFMGFTGGADESEEDENKIAPKKGDTWSPF